MGAGNFLKTINLRKDHRVICFIHSEWHVCFCC